MKHRDPLERAFELLREEHGPALADPALEARLVARAREGSPRRTSPRRRIAAAILVPALIAGAAFGTGFGIRWIRAWVLRVEVDGSATEETIEGDGARRFRLRTAGGGEADVRVERESVDGASRTRIAIDRIEGGRIEAERAEDVVGRARPLQPITVLGDEPPFYVGADPAGGRIELYALRDGAGGSRLYVARSARHPGRVEELAHLPFELLAEGARTEIRELEGGALALSFTDGRGAELAFVLAPQATAPRRSSLQTTDGAIRVEVDDASIPSDASSEGSEAVGEEEQP